MTTPTKSKFVKKPKRPGHVWNKEVVTAAGGKVVTGTAAHRKELAERHAAGLPAQAADEVSPLPNALYNKYHPVNARKLIGLGASDTDVVEFFGISMRTLYLWMTDHPEFYEAMRYRDADGVARDDRVKKSLYNRATGYSFHSEKVFCQAGGEVTRVPFVEHIPPDVKAQTTWLRARDPDNWGDRRQVDVTARVAAITATTSQPDALALFRAVLDGATLDLDES